MEDKRISLVTGANGHLGNNLVRELLKQGTFVRASVRDVTNKQPFEGLSCQIVYADMLDRDSLYKAFKEVDTLYHVAAVFKHWAKDPKKEILEANLTGTRNVLETAAVCGINKIIYVGSIAALDFSADIVDETTWGKAFPTMYFKSKNDSEKLAWHLAEKLSLPMITVLPSGMIGPEITKHLTPAMELLYKIVRNKLIFDPRFEINYVHVRDVAAGMILAEKYGRPGERYILGNEYSLSTTEVIKIANKLYPTIRIPRKVSKNVQLLIATAMEVFSKYTGNPPLLLRSNVKHYYKKKENLNILKARNDLGYNPMKPEEAVKEALESFYKQL